MRGRFRSPYLLISSSESTFPSIDIPPRNLPVRINPPVPQERPVGPLHVEPAQVTCGNHQFFLVDAPLRHDLATGITHEALPPELDSAAGVPFMSHPVRHRHEHTIRNGVAPLNRLPGGMLGLAVLRLLF